MHEIIAILLRHRFICYLVLAFLAGCLVTAWSQDFTSIERDLSALESLIAATLENFLRS